MPDRRAMALCCRICAMGPCRLVGKTSARRLRRRRRHDRGPQLCPRMVAAGTAAHSDHGRDMALTLMAVAKGEAQGYQIRDEAKLLAVAGYLGIETEGRDQANEIAVEVGDEGPGGVRPAAGRADIPSRAPPKKRQEIWRELGIAPRGIDREVVECCTAPTMGVDQDSEHILRARHAQLRWPTAGAAR